MSWPRRQSAQFPLPTSASLTVAAMTKWVIWLALLAIIAPALCLATNHAGVFNPVAHNARARAPVVFGHRIPPPPYPLEPRGAPPPSLSQPQPPSEPVSTTEDGKKKPFFLVAAPESSGNRYVVRLLSDGGCHGHSNHHQPFDQRGDWDRVAKSGFYSSTAKAAPCYVMHRSVPHAAHWPDLRRLATSIQMVGMEPVFITVHRNASIVAASQVHEKHVRTRADAEFNIRRAERELAEQHAWARSVGIRVVELEFARMGDDDYMQRTLYTPLGRPVPVKTAKTQFANPDAKYK